jgi:acyl carrier protein
MSHDIRSIVSAFLIDNFRFGDPGVTIDPEESLIEAGFIDSTGVLELVAFLEETFAITVADEEIVPANLDALSAIAAYVARMGGTADRAA